MILGQSCCNGYFAPYPFRKWQKSDTTKTTYAPWNGRNTSACARVCTSESWVTVLLFEDGIYILLKEVIDNSIDEYVMGNGKQIDISIIDGTVRIRDYGRGIRWARWWIVFPKSTQEVNTIQKHLRNR